jgi:hypothetical protein
MKMIVKEEANEGFMSLIGQRITCFCAVYIYTGDLVGVNDTCIKLDNASIVYETGDFSDRKWKDAQALPHSVYLQVGMIESFMVLK